MSAVILLCDRERSYCLHLLEYLHSAMPGREMEAYTDPERMLQGGVRPAETELLIIAENALTAEVQAAGFPKCLVLSESGAVFERLPCISKYQSMEVVMENIRSLAQPGEGTGVLSIRHGAPMRTIGFYTPCTRCLQTLLAMTAGELLAEEGEALYMNFEPYSGLSHLLGRHFRGSMGELVYYNDCDMKKVAPHLDAIRENVGGLFVVPPAAGPADLFSTAADLWVSLFSTLNLASEYAALLLDLTDAVPGLFEILRACDFIYTIERRDPVSTGRLLEFEQNLVRMHGEDIRAKTRRVELPRFERLPREYDRLKTGELADYTRRLLAGDGLLQRRPHVGL